MRLVIVESPYAADPVIVNSWPRFLRPLVAFFLRRRNVRYARAVMHDCIRRGEFPIASHLLYTQPGILRDEDPVERHTGITAGLVWAEAALAWARIHGPDHQAVRVVAIDYGISRGMTYGIEHAKRIEQEIEYRVLQRAAL